MDRAHAAPPAAAFGIAWAASTDPGSRSRHQDRFAVRADPPILLVVADGLGGHRAGDRAAELVVAAFLDVAGPGLRGVALLEAGAAAARDRLAAEAATHPECEGMGSTVVAATLDGGRLHHLHAGDSRLFLARGERLELLTFPDELTAQLRREGVLDADEARHSPLRGRLTSYLGMPGARPRLGSFEAACGDRLALVSDGVLEGGEERLAAILAGADPAEAARALVHGAPTEDNATAVIAHLVRRRDHAE